MMRSRYLKIFLPLLIFVVPGLCLAQSKTKAEKAHVLRLCEQYIGEPVNKDLDLFEANSFYVLHLVFNRNARLEKIEVVPKYYFEESSHEWAETSSFEYLSWAQYQNLLAKVELIKPRGKLITPAPPVSIVTNGTAWFTEVYKNAVFTRGELVDIDQSENAPTEVKWFRLEFVKNRRQKLR